MSSLGDSSWNKNLTNQMQFVPGSKIPLTKINLLNMMKAGGRIVLLAVSKSGGREQTLGQILPSVCNAVPAGVAGSAPFPDLGS